MINNKTEHCFECVFKNNPAAIERIIRTIRARGYNISHWHMDLIGNNYKATFTVYSERSMGSLLAQLDKLVDVTEIKPLVEWRTQHSTRTTNNTTILSSVG